jgi:hypothetical protein
MKSFNARSKNWLVSILIILAFGVIQVIAGVPSTNSIPPNLFLTDNGSLFWYKNSTGERVVHIKDIEAATNSPESRPASQDSEGHWGRATNGFQISLRFEKELFTNGESIVAITLIRNITSQPQNYFRPVQIVATKDGKPLERKDKKEIDVIEITMPPETTVFPQTQQKNRARLDQIYDLTQSGEYVFQAVCHHPEVASQKVSIVIKN